MTTINEELARYNKDVEAYLIKSNVFCIMLLNYDLNILDCNIGFMRLFNPLQKPVGEPLSSYLDLDKNRDIMCGEEIKVSCSRKSGMEGIFSCYLVRTENGYLLLCERMLLTASRALEQMGGINDELINLQRELVKKNHLQEKLRVELDQRILELEAALERVKQLEGVIPICTYCKKIRDDQNSWHKLETYISNHSEAMFTHGACPDCLEKQLAIIRGYE
jgi:hypothetical protein